MILPTTNRMEIHTRRVRRLAGLVLCSAVAFSFATLGCAQGEKPGGVESTSAAAASRPPRSGGGDSGLVTTVSTGETASTSRPAAATTAATDSLCEAVNGAKGVQPGKPGKDPLLVDQSEYDGWKMFHVYCYRCHGVDAMGGGIAPNLRHSLGPEGSVDHACFTKTVTEGRLPKGMPSWKQLLDPNQIENIWHYLEARSSGRLVPGRPHTAGGNG